MCTQKRSPRFVFLATIIIFAVRNTKKVYYEYNDCKGFQNKPFC